MLNITTNLAFTTCNLILPGRDLFSLFVFFFNNTTTTEIYTLSLHDALPIFEISPAGDLTNPAWNSMLVIMNEIPFRSEEHTSELQSHSDLVCRLLLEKKKTKLAAKQQR